MGAKEIGKDEYPTISVITPNKNGGHTLRETILSVLEQDYPALEYIIVDGGSTDDSLDIINKFRDQISTVIRGMDRTMYDGIAKGFERANGEIFAWLNSDDIYEPGILHRVGSIFSDHPDWDVIYFNGTVWKQGWRVPNRFQRCISLPELLKGHILYQDNVFFRRRAYVAVGGLEREELRFAGDYYLWLKIAARFKFHLLAGHGSCFRIRPNQLSEASGDYIAEMQLLRRQTLQHLPKGFWLKSIPGILARRIKTKNLRRRTRLYFELSDERKNWSPVVEPCHRSMRDCLCPICRSAPHRLLFSTPDSRFGNRTIRRVYLCEDCDVAFQFPAPTERELAELHKRAYSGDIAPHGEVPEGEYSPFRRSTLLKDNPYFRMLNLLWGRYVLLCQHLGWNTIPDSDITIVEEEKQAPILEIGCFEGRVLEWLKAHGYSNLFGCDLNVAACRVAMDKGFNVYAGDILDTDWPGSKVQAILLNQLIEHVHDPIEFLAALKVKLQPGGRIYLSTPNLDSRWLDHYGPSWSHWHFPFHQFIVGRKGIRSLARQAGFTIRWLKTNTPNHWVFMSDHLGERGLGGYFSHNFTVTDQSRWKAAVGATLHSALFLDWRLQGDCLYACLER